MAPKKFIIADIRMRKFLTLVTPNSSKFLSAFMGQFFNSLTVL